MGSVALLSFFTGEVIGMKSGYAYTLKLTSPLDAAYTVSVINMLEKNMYEEAKEMLETKLDNYIVNHWSASQCRLIVFNPFLKKQPQNELFYSIISHRKTHPSSIEIIQNHLENIEKNL